MNRTFLFISMLALSLSCSNPIAKDKTQDLALSKLSVQLDSVFDVHGLMGLETVLLLEGEVAYHYKNGFRDYERNLQIDDQTIYRIASISKTITATAVMQLVERGQLDLNTDVSAYLGWSLQNPSHPDSPITLHHLLSHQSGIRDGKGYGNFTRNMRKQQLDIKELFQPKGKYFSEDLFANHKPGEYFSYTNCTWGIIASIIEKVSDLRFDQYCKQHIFDPLDIAGSFNVLDIEDINDLATLYRYDSIEWKVQVDHYQGVKPDSVIYRNYQLGQNGLLFGPQGSLRVSSNDLVKLAQMMMQGGTLDGTKILDPGSLENMKKGHYVFEDNNGDTWEDFFLSYGYGLHRILNKENGDIIFPDRKMYGHPGIAYGLLSDMYFDPVTKSGVIFITNGSKYDFKYGQSSSFYEVEEAVFQVLYEDIKSL
ncbi:MAG: serine hydrolase domain-containing protein [Bacteroidota bacterium]